MSGGRRGIVSNKALLPFVKSNEFKKDYAVVCSDARLRPLTASLWAFLEIARKKEPIPAEYQTHDMRGKWKGYSDTHVANDLVVIWRYVTLADKSEVVVLQALGTHAYLGI